ARERLPGVELTAHFHNTRGQGLANVLAALESGVRSFESSFGELGGCPVPAGATGNIASEDLASMLHEMGYSTGIDLEALLECARTVQRVLGRALSGHVIVAASFELDFGGRLQWLARVAPAREGTNAIGRIPARGERHGTLVLVAHLDAAQTGIAWRIVERNGRARERGFPGWMPDRDVMAS